MLAYFFKNAYKIQYRLTKAKTTVPTALYLCLFASLVSLASHPPQFALQQIQQLGAEMG